MIYAIVENGIVVNIALSEAPLADNWIASDTAGIGDVYDNGVFTPVVDLEALAHEARIQRDKALKASDWTQAEDAPVDQAAWATYRQALRDISSQDEFPTEVIWPVEP